MFVERIVRSEFRDLWLAHGHDRLHVSLEQARHDTTVETTFLRSIELQLKDVTVLVTNR